MVQVVHTELVFDYSKIKNSVRFTNLLALPRGTGCRFLEVMESHRPQEYIAVRWRNIVPLNPEPGHLFIDMLR